jgi:protein-L-isoaspartate(D-aspartate) O-methyltransferase
MIKKSSVTQERGALVILRLAPLLPCWILLAAVNFLMSPLNVAAEDSFTLARKHMVSELAGGAHAITNAQVLAAMGKVPRHEFVPSRYQSEAYLNRPLPIGHGQPISEPYVVAFMTEKIEPRPGDRVLEIGTGSGYQAAVLAELTTQVYTIEIIPDLANRAAATLQRLDYTNVCVRAGDGYKGWPEAAPFDAIIVTCSPEKVPQPLIDQLKEGGRMIIPIGSHSKQELVLLHKHDGRLDRKAVLPIHFVPMTGEAQGSAAKTSKHTIDVH